MASPLTKSELDEALRQSTKRITTRLAMILTGWTLAIVAVVIFLAK